MGILAASYPPQEIAGLIKGNHWLISADQKAGYFWGGLRLGGVARIPLKIIRESCCLFLGFFRGVPFGNEGVSTMLHDFRSVNRSTKKLHGKVVVFCSAFTSVNFGMGIPANLPRRR